MGLVKNINTTIQGYRIVPINSRQLKLFLNTEEVAEIKDEDFKIVNLICEDKLLEPLNKTLNVLKNGYSIPYTIREISKGIDNSKSYYYLNTHIRTKSTYFLLPFLGGNKEFFEVDDYLVNCYCGNKTLSTNKLFLLYRYYNDPFYEEFEKNLLLHPQYTQTIDIDHSYVLYEFRVKNEFKDDIIKFLSGKYSKISNIGKKRIIEFNNFHSSGQTSMILFKNPAYKKICEANLGITINDSSELYDIPNLNEEIYEKVNP